MGLTRPSVGFLREGGSADGSSPAEDFAPEDSTAERVVRCPWGQRYDAVVYFLGYSTLAGGTLQRLTPQPHPDFPGVMYATKASIMGWKFAQNRDAIDGTKANTFTKAHVRVGYNQVRYAVKEDYGTGSGNDISSATAEYERFTYIDAVEPEAEYLSLPSGNLCYTATDGSSKGPVPVGVGKIIPITAVDIKWVRLPYALYSLVAASNWQKRIWGDPGTSVKPLIGRINKTQLFNWAPGTALLENVKLEIHTHPTIGFSWDVTFKFKINLNADGKGWNWLYNYGSAASPSGWYFVSDAASPAYFAPGSVLDGKSIYNEGELKDCWNVT